MDDDHPTLSLALVIPVYQGETTLGKLLEEIAALQASPFTAAGREIRLSEVVLVHDGAIDDSATVMEELAERHPFVQNVWLSRNFGQHPATVAGISATTADWVVTMDEDGLHDPQSIPDMLERAIEEGADLVYGTPSGGVPHAWHRNMTSSMAKRVFRLLVGAEGRQPFTSYRLVDGVVGRSLAAYYGQGVYFDIALTWVVGRTAYQPVAFRRELRAEGERSGYNVRKLLSHFRRLVVTSGTRPLRAVAVMGLIATALGLTMAVVVLCLRIFGDIQAEGWASVMIVISIFSGLILTALGVIAEYLSVAINMASGRPPYLAVHRPPSSSTTRTTARSIDD